MKRRLTVVRVIDRLNVGGPAIHAALTSRHLDRTRFRTVLVHGSIEPGEADMGDLVDDDSIERVVIPSLGRELRPLGDARTLAQLVRLFRRVRPDVVHTHKAKAGALGRLAALIAGVPVRVHTFHGHVFHGYFSPAKTAVFLGIERALARTTHRIIALSDSLVDELSQKYAIAPRERFHVVPLGFDLEPFRRADSHRGSLRRELGAGDGVRLVGIVGRMVPVKDHGTFVRAMAQLPAGVHAVFIGGGELEAEVKELVASTPLAGRAHFLGWRRDLERIYPDLDVVALSSVNEGTPVALIEAMASGIPVASTAVGGVPDVLRQGRWGELADRGDAASLAQAISRALEPAARERAARMRDEVLAAYGYDRLCADLAALYETLVNQGD